MVYAEHFRLLTKTLLIYTHDIPMTVQPAENNVLPSLRMRGSMGSQLVRLKPDLHNWFPAFAGMTGSSNLTTNPLPTDIDTKDTL